MPDINGNAYPWEQGGSMSASQLSNAFGNFGATNSIPQSTGFNMQTNTAPSLDFFNSTQAPQGFTNNNFSQTNTGFGAATSEDPFGLLASTNAQLGQQQTPTGLAGVSAGDWLNFGSGLLQTGLGVYSQNQALDQSQQSLDLTKQKYTDYRADKAALQAANQERADYARSQGA